MQLILCSGSERRFQLLKQMGFHAKVVVSEFQENLSKDNMTPIEYVTATSLGKLEWVKGNFSLDNSILLSADTIVTCGGVIYEKPLSKESNLQMLNTFMHNGYVEVITAVHLFNSETNELDSFTSTTKCHLASWLTSQDLNSYVETHEGLQVAGGFKIQGIGGMLFDCIEGDYYNVVGLPFSETYRRIKKLYT